jgi:hypothetical protein
MEHGCAENSPIQDDVSGIVPRKAAMKLNPCAFSNEPDNESFGRRKTEQNAVRIDAGIKTALDELGGNEERRAAFLRLLTCVRARTQLLKPRSAGWVAPLFLIQRLKNLAARQRHWIRPCETWQPEAQNLRPAFRAIAFHLLIRYPVPGFMDSVWDLPAGPQGFRQRSWYIRLGRGTSFRALNPPLVLTRKMEHFVRQAPDHYTVSQALRYGETRGLGGSEALAHEIVASRLGQKIAYPEFWRTVLWFFLAHPETGREQVNPIIDFIQANKFAGEEVVTENGAECRTAPWPHFSMKGRTLKSILRLICAWHSDHSMNEKGPSFSLAKSGIQSYRFLESRAREQTDLDWTIQEILESRALQAEGRAMRHCVYSYANRCWRGETTIWSLRLRVNYQEKSMATIELDPRRRAIVQARAKCNMRPGGRSNEIIRQWAVWAGLQFDPRL